MISTRISKTPPAPVDVVDHREGAGQHDGGEDAEGRDAASLGQERRGEQPVLGGGVRGLGAHQGPAVERADDRDDGGEGDDRAAPVPAEHHVHRVGERRLGLHQLVVGDGAEDGDGAQEVDHGGADGAEDGGPADVPLRVADLARAHRGGLHTDVGVEQDRGGRGHPADRAAAALVERAEVGRVEEEQADDGDEEQRDELEDGGDRLDQADVTGAGEVGEGRQPERAEGDREVGGVGGAAGEQDMDVADDGDRERRVADPGHGPVRPGGEESGEVAERLARVDVGASGVRVALGEPSEDEGEGDGADGQDAEGDQADGAERGHRGRQQKDAATDDVAHHQAGGGSQSEAAAVPVVHGVVGLSSCAVHPGLPSTAHRRRSAASAKISGVCPAERGPVRENLRPGAPHAGVRPRRARGAVAGPRPRPASGAAPGAPARRRPVGPPSGAGGDSSTGDSRKGWLWAPPRPPCEPICSSKACTAPVAGS